MNLVTVNIVVILLIVESLCQRRITRGRRVKVNKPYMVYIVWDTDPKSEDPIFYNDERDKTSLCGGSIITPNYVLTSAACMIVKPKQFVVAGYNKYVPYASNDSDPCLMKTRRRIVLKCYHRDLNAFNYTTTAYYKMITWAKFYDYATVKVDRPYDFNDNSYLTHCSYIPGPINVYFETNVPVGTHVVTFGWGSPKYQRPHGYRYDVNQKYLMGTSSILINKEICTEPYSRVGMELTRLKCSDGVGKLDFDGSILVNRRDNSNRSFEDEPLYVINKKDLSRNETVMYFDMLHNATRRINGGGPCQNDHGGPLVAWIKGIEYIIGVITGYLVNDRLECVGPYVFTNIVKHFVICTTDIKTPLRQYTNCTDSIFFKFDEVIEDNINWN